LVITRAKADPQAIFVTGWLRDSGTRRGTKLMSSMRLLARCISALVFVYRPSCRSKFCSAQQQIHYIHTYLRHKVRMHRRSLTSPQEYAPPLSSSAIENASPLDTAVNLAP
jgi:hypothetical protein